MDIIEKITNKVSARNDDTDLDNILRTADTAQLTLHICFSKKFIKVDTNILLCEGRTKVIGCVKNVI